MNAFAAGILLGLAGSAHCAGMCGPLVLTVSGWVDPRRSRLPPLLAYHAGRVLVYLVLSVAAGLTGHALSYGGFGRGVSIAAGLLLLAVAAGSASRLIPRRAWLFWSLMLTRACVAANRSTRAHPIAGQVLAGAANGLLPCGLVYAAAIAAAGLGSLSGAVVFMAGFGLGTVPVLLGMSLSAASLSLSARARLRRLTPVALALTGTLLIARGVLPAHHAAGAQGAASALIHHTH
jgi:hypothetical protein